MGTYTFNYTAGSEQFFTAPTSGVFNIAVQGASGGQSENSYSLNQRGGYGAYEKASFNLTAGEKLDIIVGGAGGGTSTYGGGGGGATEVWVDSSPTHPLIVAGGGGGASNASGYGNNATTTTSTGAAGASPAGAGGGTWGGAAGTGGNGGGGGTFGFLGHGTNAGGGAGWNSNGGYGNDQPRSTGGYSHANGSAGGTYGTGSGNGGFGGGGAGGGGGGGGYNGGGGASDINAGGGGGSYVATGATNITASNIQSLYEYSGAVTITAVCYLPGTLIETTQGEVAVEELKVGDLVPTLSGKELPIKWIGRQHFDGRFQPVENSPVCIKEGALGENLPKRDLHVSAGHSIKINDHLVDAALLVNGITITQEKLLGQVEYFHIDLGEHHCIRAEGSWAESYAEAENRESFDNADEFHAAYPDHVTAWSETCLPHVNDFADPRLPELLQSVLAHLPERSVTMEADVHVLADGKRIDAQKVGKEDYNFRIPTGTKVLRLKSHSSSPREIGESADPRELGFCLRGITGSSLDGSLSMTLAPHHHSLSEGFHAVEGVEGTTMRWSKGNALLPKMLLGDHSEEILLTISGTTLSRYHLRASEIRQKAFRVVKSEIGQERADKSLGRAA